MHPPLTNALRVFAVWWLTCALAATAHATTITYEFSGVFRFPFYPGHPIHQGDTYRGTFFFDPDRAYATYAIDGYKHYDFQFATAGVEVEVATSSGVLTFANVPGYIAADVLNDYVVPGQAMFDRLYVRCAEFLRFPDFYRRRWMELGLDIYSRDASLLESLALPSRLSIPANGYAMLNVFGGPGEWSLDYGFSLPFDRLGPPNRPPDCTAVVGRIPQATAVNGAWAPVTIEGVTDPDGDPVSIAVSSVTQDEPVADLGARPTCPDATIENGSARVRMERSGTGNGRVYHLGFTASDGRGGASCGSVTVCVPHDQGTGGECVDEGPLYNSLGSCSGATTIAAARAQGAGLGLQHTAGGAWALDFSLPAEGEVFLSVHDVAGRRIATLAGGRYETGSHRVEWKADGLAPGVYFARLRAGATTVVKRFAIL